MDTFSKSILKVGTYHSPDGTVEVTPERLRHWEAQARRLQAVGYDLPSHFNHANEIDLLEPIPANPEQRQMHRGAQHTVGHLAPMGFVVAPDGQSAEITLKTLTDGAKEAVSKNAVYVSPVIFPEWKDGAGNTYADVITSFDLVDHPVDYSQSSFVPAIRMGLNSKPYQLRVIKMSEDRGKPTAYFTNEEGVTIPIFGKKKRDKKARAGRMKSKSRKRMSLLSAIRMSAEDSVPSEQIPESSEPAESNEVITDESYDAVDDVLDLLEEFGIALPEDTDDSNLKNHLRVALTALLNSRQMENETEDPKELEGAGAALPSDAPGSMPVASAPSIATMSVQARAAMNFGERIHRESIAARIDGLLKTGRCTPAEADAQSRALTAVKLSLTADGNPIKSDVDKWLDSREPVPVGTFWTDKQRSEAVKLSLVPAPSEWRVGASGQPTQSESDAAVSALMGKRS